MAYKRRRYTKSRKTYVRKAEITPAVKKVLYSVQELKWKNAAVATLNPGTTWTFTSALTAIDVGTGVSDRIGNMIFLKSITYTVSICPKLAAASATADGGAICRIIWYHNKDCDGALTTGLDVFNTDNFHSNRNQTKVKQVSILDDKVFPMMYTSGDATLARTTGAPTMFKKTIYPKKKICFKNTGAGIANLEDHDYGFAVASDASNCCEVIVHCQVLFTDA